MFCAMMRPRKSQRYGEVEVWWAITAASPSQDTGALVFKHRNTYAFVLQLCTNCLYLCDPLGCRRDPSHALVTLAERCSKGPLQALPEQPIVSTARSLSRTSQLLKVGNQ